MLDLRPYQVEAIEAIASAESQGIQRPLIVHPTGVGKTVCFSHLIASRPGRSIVLVHRDELVNQAVDKLSIIAPELPLGVVKAERDEGNADVVVASVQTAHRPNRLNRLNGFDTVVVDEAHHAPAPSWMRVLDHLGSFNGPGDNHPLTVGFTATPERDKGKRLGDVWQEVVHYRSIREMIFEDYLVPPVGQTVNTSADFSKVRVSHGDFSEGDLGAVLEQSGALVEIADAYVTYAKDRKGVAFTPTVATAHGLARQLAGRGISAEAVDASTPLEERRAVLGRLTSGETHVVTNCAVLTEGFDEPSIDCIVVARPTRFHGLYVQMVGRGLRKHPGKTDLLVLDVTGASERHDLVAVVDLGLGGTAEGKKDKRPGFGRDCAVCEFGCEDPELHFCELCDRQLPADLVAAGDRRHDTCRARRTKKVDVFATSKLRWLPVENGYCLPAGKDTVVMVPLGGDLWRLASYSAGRIEVLHGSLPVDWAQGIGEDRAKAFGKLAKRGARWLDEAPTDRQLSRLIREGLPEHKAARVRTRGEAADLITRIQARRAVRKLRRSGRS